MKKPCVSKCGRIQAVALLVQTLSIAAVFAVPLYEPTHTAVPTAGSMDIPGSDFEEPSIPGFAPQTTWQGWTFTGGGIVREWGLTYAAGQLFTRGAYGVYLPGNHSISRTVNLPAGTWQISFEGGQRLQNGAFHNQQLRVTVDSLEILDEVLVGGLKRIHSRPFNHSGGNITLKLAGTSTTGQSVILDDIRAVRVGLWTNASTWQGGQVPSSAAHHVLIPAGVAVAIEENHTGRVGHVIVNGNLSVLETTGTGVGSFGCSSLIVDGPGAELQIGLSGSEYLGKFELQLHGSNAAEDLEGFGTKFLGARNGGLISLHGRPVKPYTTLASTAEALATTIDVSLTAADDWRVGDKVWISPTFGPVREQTGIAARNGWDQEETRTVTAISSIPGQTDRLRIGLDSPLVHKHLGTSFTANRDPEPAKDWIAETRAVVALRNRNLVIRGMSPGTAEFGGHVMIMGKTNPSVSAAGIARISNVQFDEMGQKEMLGRYPFHWHMLAEDGANQYLKDCVINNSFNRAITIHGTHNTVVDRNVAIKHIGHGLFLEDGAEINNTITRNVIALSMRPAVGSELLISDVQFLSGEPGEEPPLNQNNGASPAAFWISHPQNVIDDNIAVGTHGVGYWFVFNFSPTGASNNDARLNTLNARQSSLISFDNNTAFATALAFDVNDDVDEINDFATRSNYPWLPPTPQYLNGLFAWANDIGIYAGLGTPEDTLFFKDASLIGNRLAVRFAAYLHLEESLVVADTPDNLYPGSVLGINTYDGAGRFHNNHYVYFNLPAHWLVSPGGGAAPNNNWIFSGSSYNHEGLPNVLLPASAPGRSDFTVDSLIDRDGTLSGYPDATIVSDTAINRMAGDPPKPGNWLSAFPVLRDYSNLQFFGAASSDTVTAERHHLNSSTPTVSATVTTASPTDPYGRRVLLPIMNNPNVEYHLKGLLAPTLKLWFADCINGDDVVLVLPDYGPNARLTKGTAITVSSLTALRAATSTAFFKDGSTVYLKYVRVSESFSDRDELIVSK